VSASENWQGDVEVIPTIVSLRARLEEIRLGEVRKTLARLSDAGPETRAAIDALRRDCEQDRPHAGHQASRVIAGRGQPLVARVRARAARPGARTS
jgi:hypothetical protein